MIAVWKIYWFDLFWSLYPVLYSIFTFVQYFYAYWASSKKLGYLAVSEVGR